MCGSLLEERSLVVNKFAFFFYWWFTLLGTVSNFTQTPFVSHPPNCSASPITYLVTLGNLMGTLVCEFPNVGFTSDLHYRQSGGWMPALPTAPHFGDIERVQLFIMIPSFCCSEFLSTPQLSRLHQQLAAVQFARILVGSNAEAKRRTFHNIRTQNYKNNTITRGSRKVEN